MWIFLTMLAYLLGVIEFLSVWIEKRSARVLTLILSLGSAGALLFIIKEPFGFFVAFFCGFFLWGVMELRKREAILCAVVMAISCIVPWVPILMCKGMLWEYGIIIAGVMLSVAFCVGDKILHGELPTMLERVSFEKGQAFYQLIPLFIIPLGFFVMVEIDENSFWKALLQCGVLFCVLILLCILQELTYQYMAMRRMNDALSAWQREARDYMNVIRSQRHDFNLHLHAISGLVQSKEYQECNAYVRRLLEEATAINDIMPVADAVVGSMLLRMREQARQRGFDIYYHITYDMEDIICNGFECNKIIGNLLQNAIDALKTPEDFAYGIHANILKRRGYTVIVVENRFTGDKEQIAKAFEPGFTTKQNHEGIGLSMVMRAVKQYGGMIYSEFEDDKIRFVVNIPNRVIS